MSKKIGKMQSRNILIFTSIAILLILIITCFIIQKKYNFFNNTKYISTNKRKNYIINNVDETLLTNYISKKQNTLIIFWASWCSTCVEEADELNKFITNNPNLPIIIVSHDRELSDLENYLTTKNYKWFVIFDTDKTIRENIDKESKWIPSLYLLDKDLNIISSSTNSMTEEELLNFYNLKE